MEVHNSMANEACTLCRVAPLRSKRWLVEKQREHVHWRDTKIQMEDRNARDGHTRVADKPHACNEIWEKPFPHVLTCSLREGLVDDILNFARVDGQTITCANCSRVLMSVMTNSS